MIVSRQHIAAPRAKLTVHRFVNHQLINNAQTDISWWNPSDHTQPFPWRMDQTFAPPLMQQYYADLDDRFSEFLTDDAYSLMTGSYHQGPSDPVPVNALMLMAVDASGADLYDLFNPPTIRPEAIYGLYVKQTVAHWAVTRDFNPLVLLWKFANKEGIRIAPAG